MQFRHGLFIVVGLAMLRSCICLASPCISFPDGGISFGGIPIGTNAVRHLELRNTGSVFVSVSRVKACCGVVAELNPTTIAPGGVATLSVSFTPKFTGVFSKKIQISFSQTTRIHSMIILK